MAHRACQQEVSRRICGTQTAITVLSRNHGFLRTDPPELRRKVNVSAQATTAVLGYDNSSCSPPATKSDVRAQVRKYAGESAPIQRCQVHKRRNVLDHLTDEQKPAVAKKLNVAYALQDYAAAKQALNALHRELMDLNPSAARSLGEGMEETLTVHRLQLPMQLRKTMAGTNVIESAFSIVEQVCRNVKRWHAGDQRERWVGSGLLVAEQQFRRVQGYEQIPMLIRELEAHSE